jgi:hypothetical protein
VEAIMGATVGGGAGTITASVPALLWAWGLVWEPWAGRCYTIRRPSIMRLPLLIIRHPRLITHLRHLFFMPLLDTIRRHRFTISAAGDGHKSRVAKLGMT